MKQQRRSDDSEEGAIRLQNLITLAIFALVVWAMIAFFPYFNIPLELKNRVEKEAEGYYDTGKVTVLSDKKKIRAAEESIKAAIRDVLEEHEYDEEALDKCITKIGPHRLEVSLTYTIKVNYIGNTFTFERQFEYSKQAPRF